MRIFHDPNSFQAYRLGLSPTARIGFVPTMGNLHQGHASLIERSKAENALTFVSIYVNPTQFNNPEDFKHYPKTLDHDIALLEQLGVDACFIPDENSLYPDHFHYQMTEHHLALPMEGHHRPGHFTGVLTIVMKLYQLTQPHKMYFGEKDYQQYLLIKGMAEAFFWPCEIVSCPTIRETSGLALSSRNNRLSPQARQQADAFATLFHQMDSIQATIEALNARGITVDYIEEHHNRRFAAVFIDGIRLIDNIEL